MSSNDPMISLLTRIEENQRQALEVQQRQLELAQAQLERSNQSIRESLDLQRLAVARQARLVKFAVPLIGVLLLLLAYLLFKWRIF
jgi:VIT1/CCC1 family predicted Fe2+/Mn2+ transporter